MSNYADYATRLWNLSKDGFSKKPGGRPWSPVVKDGRRWTGDPTLYEKACGATFLTDDGHFPGEGDPIKGRAGDSGSTPWYDWLRGQPAKWAAFNAWLQDPAVEAFVSPRADNIDAGAGFRQQRYGSAAGCTHREDAGTLLGSAS